MKTVRFTRNFDYRPTYRDLVCFKANTEVVVSDECAAAAVEAKSGSIVEIENDNDGEA